MRIFPFRQFFRNTSYQTEDLIISVVFLIGSACSLFLWSLDFIYHMMTPFNNIAMPLATAVMTPTAFVILLSPRYRTKALIFGYSYLSLYFQLDIYDIFLSSKNPHYALLLISQFFPLLYLISHFCIPQKATLVSWINYIFLVCTFFLLLSLFPHRFDKLIVKEILAVVITQPIYLICLHFILQLRRKIQDASTREQILSDQLIKDALTSIPNRIAIQQRIKEDEESSSPPPLAVYVIDIDFFKKVNDTYGHNTGDAVLKAVALQLSKAVRNQDVVGRWGGEEFLAIAYHLTYPQAIQLGERLLHCVQSIVPFEGNSPITLSIGMSYRHQKETILSLIEQADTQVYRAKHQGRNQLCVIPSP